MLERSVPAYRATESFANDQLNVRSPPSFPIRNGRFLVGLAESPVSDLDRTGTRDRLQIFRTTSSAADLVEGALKFGIGGFEPGAPSKMA